MNANFVLLHVADTAASSRFYETILQRSPIDTSPTFVLFEAGPALKLGLWRKDGVEPAATAAGGFELGIPVGSKAAVDATAADWAGHDVTILQAPVEMDFGRTFTAEDPDGHRVRVFCPGEA
jgi:catechol 2,3-dioxygenase-like lactoylglutathione lyase family enzyme